MNIKIACPKCDWEPDADSRWQCTCGHSWNTFETSGKCPNCSRTWEYTQCQEPGFAGGCGAWSKHIDWYRNLESELRKEIEQLFEGQPSS
ncbi:MAG: hypothetical protein ACOVO3_01045 [Fluviicola sp.]